MRLSNGALTWHSNAAKEAAKEAAKVLSFAVDMVDHVVDFTGHELKN